MSSFCSSSLFSATPSMMFSLSSICNTSVRVAINIKASRCCWESELLSLFLIYVSIEKASLACYLCDGEGEQEPVCYDVICFCQEVGLLQNSGATAWTVLARWALFVNHLRFIFSLLRPGFCFLGCVLLKVSHCRARLLTSFCNMPTVALSSNGSKLLESDTTWLEFFISEETLVHASCNCVHDSICGPQSCVMFRHQSASSRDIYPGMDFFLLPGFCGKVSSTSTSLCSCSLLLAFLVTYHHITVTSRWLSK